MLSKLEWIGDAVLCLAIREWVFKNYPSLQVAELVVLESMLVCNETLAFLGYSEGLHQILSHRDPSLPRRFEEFQREIGKQGRGLWGTDPPKVLPDVVEALLGAAHEDGGLVQGQKAVLFVMRSILSAVKKQIDCEDPADIKAKVRELMHPKQVIHELAGRYLQLRSWRESAFATQFPTCPVWRGMQWGLPNTQSNDCIGQVVCCGMNVIALSESTVHIAKNRVCAFAVSFFRRCPKLLENVQKMAISLIKDGKASSEPPPNAEEEENTS